MSDGWLCRSGYRRVPVTNRLQQGGGLFHGGHMAAIRDDGKGGFRDAVTQLLGFLDAAQTVLIAGYDQRRAGDVAECRAFICAPDRQLVEESLPSQTYRHGMQAFDKHLVCLDIRMQGTGQGLARNPPVGPGFLSRQRDPVTLAPDIRVTTGR